MNFSTIATAAHLPVSAWKWALCTSYIQIPDRISVCPPTADSSRLPLSRSAASLRFLLSRSDNFLFADRMRMLGSIDANTGSPDLGWDTDQFPMDVKAATMVMKTVIEQVRRRIDSRICHVSW